MLSRLLACFALFSGLAAIGAPASASVVEALNCEIGVTADLLQNDADENRSCEDETAKKPRKAPDKVGGPAKRGKKVIRVPVLFGVDRAYE